MGYSKLQTVAGCWHREMSTTDAVDRAGSHAAASLGGAGYSTGSPIQGDQSVLKSIYFVHLCLFTPGGEFFRIDD